jgi:hypothetical protein
VNLGPTLGFGMILSNLKPKQSRLLSLFQCLHLSRAGDFEPTLGFDDSA